MLSRALVPCRSWSWRPPALVVITTRCRTLSLGSVHVDELEEGCCSLSTKRLFSSMELARMISRIRSWTWHVLIRLLRFTQLVTGWIMLLLMSWLKYNSPTSSGIMSRVRTMSPSAIHRHTIRVWRISRCLGKTLRYKKQDLRWYGSAL
jgi:hypothetical protein